MTHGYEGLKPSIEFPEAHLAMEEGLIAVGGKLDTPTLYHAYKKGIFPWPQQGYPLLWFSPDQRGVLDFAQFHIPKSLEKLTHKNNYHFTFNQAFEQVITDCQKQPRKLQNGTWIIPELKEAYVQFHTAGFAHSVECWDQGQLVGGIYGVFVEGVFSGESMFHKQPNTSKLSLVVLIEHLKKIGLHWMDIQMVTPVTEQMGGRYITRDEFLDRLRKAQQVWQKHRASF